jgi:magnesium-transporting ATPase (P-type)
MDEPVARGYVMTLMVFIQNIHVFNCRSEKNSAFSVPLKNNAFVVWGVIASIALQFVVMEVDIFSKLLQTVSIPLTHILGLFALAMIILVVVEVYKKIRFRHDK